MYVQLNMKTSALATIIAAAAAVDASTTTAEFGMFKAKFGVSYASTAEEAFRLEAFAARLLVVEAMNSDPGDPAVYGVTRTADRTPEELGARKRARQERVAAARAAAATNANANETVAAAIDAGTHVWNGTCYSGAKRAELSYLCNGTLPQAFDWTNYGAVTPIKDQGSCGNCFSFGATGDFESAWFLAGNDLVSLSEQQITACDRNGGDAGCGGGFSNLDTDEYATKNGGMALEATYPLCSGTKGKCKGR
jgi:hypothetical protein